MGLVFLLNVYQSLPKFLQANPSLVHFQLWQSLELLLNLITLPGMGLVFY